MKTSDLYLYRLNKAAQERVNQEYADRLKFRRRRREKDGIPELTDRWGRQSHRWVSGGAPIVSSSKRR